MKQEHPTPIPRMLRLRDVIMAVGLAKSTIYLKLKNGTFPPPIKLSDRAVGWNSNSIATWLAERKFASQGSAA